MKKNRFLELREEVTLEGKDVFTKCTQDELTKLIRGKTGISIKKPQISNLERGKRKPSKKELEAYSKYFNVPIEFLLGTKPNREYENINIGKELGLSDKTIAKLKAWQESEPKCNLVEVLNYIFEADYEYNLFQKLRLYLFAKAEQFIVYDDVYAKTSNNPFDFQLSASKEVRAFSKNYNFDERIKLEDVQYIFQQSLYKVLYEMREEVQKQNLENSISKFENDDFESGIISVEEYKG